MASLILTTLLVAGVAIGELPATGGGFDLPPAPLSDQATPAASGCGRAAQQAAAMTGGEVLSVEPARNGRPVCKVTVLVINARGRPKKVKLRIPMDY